MKEILEHSGVSRSEYDAPHHLHAILNQTDDSHWVFDDFETGNTIESIATEIGGIVYHMPRPQSHVDAILQYGPHFNYDMVHFSELGHASIAKGLAELLRDVNVTKSDTVNPWQEVDSCQSWYQTGSIVNVSHSDDMKLARFGRNKFGLEVKPPSSWLRINNTLPYAADVFMSYMVTAPHQDYPAVTVSLSSSMATEVVPVERTNRYSVHVVQTVFVGRATVGGSTIEITPRETTRKLPFRVTGILITGASRLKKL
jgi:hypothetical protein